MQLTRLHQVLAQGLGHGAPDPRCNRLQDVGRASVRGSSRPAWRPSPAPEPGRGVRGRRFQGTLLHQDPSVPSSGGGWALRWQKGQVLYRDSAPGPAPGPVSPAYLPAAPHLLSLPPQPQLQPPTGGPSPVCWGGHPFLSAALPAYPSAPGPWAPPTRPKTGRLVFLHWV